MNAYVEELRERYRGCKPCLHGSDSHDLASVGKPSADRYSWIKGGLEFDALRQACINPAARSFVGTEPPNPILPSQVISHASISNANWLKNSDIPLNPGLVAIIGARGSGKTALADMIAAGCDAFTAKTWDSSLHSNPSFLVRAKDLMGDAEVTLTWGGGNVTNTPLNLQISDDSFVFPRALYLSQQFVEELCSSSGVTDGLIEEIERVIFEAHPLDARNGATEFLQFREQKTSRFEQARSRETVALSDLSARIASELEKEKTVDALTSQIKQKRIQIDGFKKDLSKLVVKVTDKQSSRYTELSNAAQTLRNKVQAMTNQHRTFLAMQDEVKSTKQTTAPEFLRQTRERHVNSGLSDDQWEEFLLIYRGDVESSLSGYIKWVERELEKLNGKAVTVNDPNKPLFPDDTNLGEIQLCLIDAELKRLEGLLSEDKMIRKQYTALTKRIATEESVYKTLESKLKDAKGALDRRKNLQVERDNSYGRVFDAIISEQEALTELYEPLMNRIAEYSGTLKKLSFHIRRIADAKHWAGIAEETLLDRRKAGPFNGRGSLIALAEKDLQPAWETGSSTEIQKAMSNFISTYLSDLLSHAPVAPEQQAEFRAWSSKFAHWLYGTEHIVIQYEMIYDGVEIQKLSPGTRGVVLLLLYLGKV